MKDERLVKAFVKTANLMLYARNVFCSTTYDLLFPDESSDLNEIFYPDIFNFYQENLPDVIAFAQRLDLDNLVDAYMLRYLNRPHVALGLLRLREEGRLLLTKSALFTDICGMRGCVVPNPQKKMNVVDPINTFTPAVLEIYSRNTTLLAFIENLHSFGDFETIELLKNRYIAEELAKRCRSVSPSSCILRTDILRDIERLGVRYNPRSIRIGKFISSLPTDIQASILIHKIKKMYQLLAYDRAFRHNPEMQNKLYALLAEKIKLNKVKTTTGSNSVIRNRDEFIAKIKALKKDINAILEIDLNPREIIECMLGSEYCNEYLDVAFEQDLNIFWNEIYEARQQETAVDNTIKLFKLLKYLQNNSVIKLLISSLEERLRDIPTPIITEAFNTAIVLGMHDTAADLLIKYGTKLNSDLTISKAFETTYMRWIENRAQNKDDYDFAERLLSLEGFPTKRAFLFSKRLEQTNKPAAQELQVKLGMLFSQRP